MAKKPSFQFYPGDWRKDQNLSRASLQAKGALIEIMCLAFECEKRGYLKTGKDPWTIDEIAHAIGGDKMENILAIEELLHKKILKKDKKNTIFSARMVRDEKLSKVRRKVGLLGGNPNLVNQSANQNPTPSSSSSSSTSESIEIVKDRLEVKEPPDLNSQIRGEVISNAEAELLKNQIEFERISMSANANPKTAKLSLHKFHLYLEEKERYPMTRKAAFAGFEKWLLNESNFTKTDNGHQETEAQRIQRKLNASSQ